MLIICFAVTAHTAVPAGEVFPATNVSSRTKSESLTQEQALLPEQQHSLDHSEAAHRHYTHLTLYLQRDRRERDREMH